MFQDWEAILPQLAEAFLTWKHRGEETVPEASEQPGTAHTFHIIAFSLHGAYRN